ncbi:DUF2997 domain-containing protein [Romeria aff. gracilis LEGE 07310]|uniref:DUF2997 domain-containing protein n=1 Tax=Vasconcelosia minhoensis LEGE 07310 TaxID=915328 RepID=A0A8J7ACA7_9CYAN|nr:DUF2997 domain-containing protein [Romeria gracilis]MBE9077039.1 DUF2997 domain-containing protein [Romeria aff. gracilis LEGE 07310]
MAEYQRVEYRIGKDGKVTETVLDGQGESCTLATAEMERSLGLVESRELLPEYTAEAQNGLGVEQTQSVQE